MAERRWETTDDDTAEPVILRIGYDDEDEEVQRPISTPHQPSPHQHLYQNGAGQRHTHHEQQQQQQQLPHSGRTYYITDPAPVARHPPHQQQQQPYAADNPVYNRGVIIPPSETELMKKYTAAPVSYSIESGGDFYRDRACCCKKSIAIAVCLIGFILVAVAVALGVVFGMRAEEMEEIDQIALVSYNGQMTLDLAYQAAFSDLTSNPSVQFTGNFTGDLRENLKSNLPQFASLIVLQLSEGSVIVGFKINLRIRITVNSTDTNAERTQIALAAAPSISDVKTAFGNAASSAASNPDSSVVFYGQDVQNLQESLTFGSTRTVARFLSTDVAATTTPSPQTSTSSTTFSTSAGASSTTTTTTTTTTPLTFSPEYTPWDTCAACVAGSSDLCKTRTVSCKGSDGNSYAAIFCGLSSLSETMECPPTGPCPNQANPCLIGSNPCLNGICAFDVNVSCSYTCECSLGYVFDYELRICADIDECADQPLICDQINPTLPSGSASCDNIGGGFRCDCPDGYDLDVDEMSCLEHDECLDEPPPCDIPLPGRGSCLGATPLGSYTCSCNAPYQLTAQSGECLEADRLVPFDPASLTDGFSQRFFTPIPVPVNDEFFTSLYVTQSGLLIFEKLDNNSALAVPQIAYTQPTTSSMEDFFSGTDVAVCTAYWANMEPSAFVGDSGMYVEVVETFEDIPAHNKIVDIFSEHFAPSYAFVTTFVNFVHPSGPNLTATFQLVFGTNFTSSAFAAIYDDGMMSWDITLDPAFLPNVPIRIGCIEGIGSETLNLELTDGASWASYDDVDNVASALRPDLYLETEIFLLTPGTPLPENKALDCIRFLERVGPLFDSSPPFSL